MIKSKINLAFICLAVLNIIIIVKIDKHKEFTL